MDLEDKLKAKGGMDQNMDGGLLIVQHVSQSSQFKTCSLKQAFICSHVCEYIICITHK